MPSLIITDGGSTTFTDTTPTTGLLSISIHSTIVSALNSMVLIFLLVDRLEHQMKWNFRSMRPLAKRSDLLMVTSMTRIPKKSGIHA
jgi:hypothetical protein